MQDKGTPTEVGGNNLTCCLLTDYQVRRLSGQTLDILIPYSDSQVQT